MHAADIRVVLIEDHGIVREGIKLILEDEPGIVVAGEGPDGASGIRAFNHLLASDRPAGTTDVVVTDLSLPDMSGFEVVRRIKALRPGTPILILTMYSDDEHILAMLKNGADGYLLKQAAARELPDAIRTVACGEMALSPALTRRLMTLMQRDRETAPPVLSEREREVLSLLAEGLTSKEVASLLALSAKTIENHRARILEKLRVTNTPAAINYAAQHGLLHAGSTEGVPDVSRR